MSLPEVPELSPTTGKKPAKTPVVVILGPTGVGKTDLSIQLAEKFHGEIVSADSRLFYRGMDIGTAKPSPEDLSRVPHHLIDVTNPDEIWSLALFQREAAKAICMISAQHHLPFLVGGTGQFIRSIIEGWKIPTVAPDSHLRDVLAQWIREMSGSERHDKLEILDPVAAQEIDPSNTRRVIRAFEVIFTTGARFSTQKQRGEPVYAPLLIGLTCSRPELYRRIDERIDRMITAGFQQEVQGLLERGYSPELPTMSAIGYGEMVRYIRENITMEEAITSMKRRTRIFVRRQANWFKESDPSIHWFQINPSPLQGMERLISDWLSYLPSQKY